MRLFLAALRARYGSLEAYVTEALGMNAEALTTTLRTNLLEPTPTTWPELTYRKAEPQDAPSWSACATRRPCGNWPEA